MWDISRWQDQTAVVDEYGKILTYAMLKDCVNEIKNILPSRSLIFSLCTNSIGSVVGYVSFLSNKIVPALLNANLDQDFIDHLLSIYKPSYLWIPQEREDHFSSFDRIYTKYGYSLLKTNFEKIYPLYDDLALLLTTSGSTGSPKFVRLSYENLKANTSSIIEYLKLDHTEKAITTLPMNYSYGLSIINTHLAVGATILVTDKGLMQKEFWSFFKEQKVTSFGGVPYTYEMLDRLRFFRMDLPYLRTMTQAGGKLSKELHQRFATYAKEHGKNFVVMYGQCEATARMGYLPADKSLLKCGSIGITIPNGRFKLIDENGESIQQANVTGELVYQGSNVALGYAESGNDLIKGDEWGGCLKTGDLAQFDDEGFYYIVGRKKRFLKIFGNRINLDEIDQLLKDHYPDLELASYGVDDRMFIFINDESLQDEVKDYVVQKTGLNHMAFKVKYLSKIPKNDAGKITYKKLEIYLKNDHEL